MREPSSGGGYTLVSGKIKDSHQLGMVCDWARMRYNGRTMESERIMKRMLLWGLGACIILPGVVMAGKAIADHARTYAVYKRFGSMAAPERVKTLHRIGAERDWRLAELVRQTLDAPGSREELEAAGYAAMRLGDAEFLPMLQARADAGPDDSVRATLMMYAARMSDRDTRLCDWFDEAARSEEPWRRIGAATGLLHLGRLEAGPLLLAAVRGSDAEMAAFAWRSLAWVTGPMGQAIGQPMNWLQTDALPTEPAQFDEVEQFWRDRVTVTLLNDVVRRLTVRDPSWTEMGRLIHARNRVARLMQ